MVTTDTVTGANGCWLVGDNDTLIAVTPGTAGVVPPLGAFATYAECVAANCLQAPSEFDFAGGTLGVRFGGLPGTPWYSTGSAQGGRGPTFRLTRVDPCP